LKSLSEYRCPECGRAFDPNDPATMAKERYRFFTGWMICITLLSVPAISVWAYWFWYRPDPGDKHDGSGLSALILSCVTTSLLVPMLVLIMLAIRAIQVRR
jgi:hypothetical protein